MVYVAATMASCVARPRPATSSNNVERLVNFLSLDFAVPSMNEAQIRRPPSPTTILSKGVLCSISIALL